MMYEKFEEIPFQNRAKSRLRQIYAVIYYMQKGYSHTEAIGKALDYFPQVNDYQTIADKCGRQFAGDIPTFAKWYETRELLSKLTQKNNLNEEDKKIFAELLDTSSEKIKDTLRSENEIDGSILKEKKEVLHLWNRVLKNQSSGVEFSTIERHHQHQKMQKDARLFVKKPSSDIFTEFWNKMDAAQRVARAKNVWEANSPEILAEVISEMTESSDFKPEWVERVGSARRTLWELFGIFHIETKPLLNGCSERGLEFFGFEVRDKYEDVLSNFEKFRDEIYLEEIGHITKGLNYEVPTNLEIDQLFNVVDKTNEKSFGKAKTEEEKKLYRRIIELKETEKGEGLKEKEKSTNYFWISANPKIWSVETIKGGGSVFYTAYNKKGNRRRTFSAFEKAQPGDKVIFYETTPSKKVLALGKITKELHKDPTEQVSGITIEYVEDVEPIDWSTLISVEALKESDPIKNRAQGSLFELTKEEYEDILALEEPERKEEEQWEEVKSDLGYDLNIDFEVDSKQLFFPKDKRKNMETQITSSLYNEKHIILIGPPGTGKSKLAKQICKFYAGKKYKMSTATSDWSTFDTIGGYHPNEDGSLQFKPGIFLECFKNRKTLNPDNKWLIIDEINRADIDKAFGSLFSALTGDDITLPFDIAGDLIKVIGNPDAETKILANNFIIHPDWRIIATMNTFDKTSLYEMSYAFMRRFAFIPVEIPEEINEELIKDYLRVWGGNPENEDAIVKKLIDIWKKVNDTRQIGPAIIEDIYRYVKRNPDDYASAIIMFVLPQFEGLIEDKIITFVNRWDIGGVAKVKKFCSDFFDIEKEKFEKKTEEG